MAVLLIAVVLVAEEVLAVLTLRPDASLGDEEVGRDGGSCADVAKGRDEGDC
jgi:hypothetical protein